MRNGIVTPGLIAPTLGALVTICGCARQIACGSSVRGMHHIHFRVVSDDSSKPIEGAHIRWFRSAYESYVSDPESVRFTDEAHKAAWLRDNLQEATTDAKGKASIERPRFSFCTTYYFLGPIRCWKTPAPRIPLRGTVEIKAHGFAPVRAPLSDVCGIEKYSTNRKRPIRANVRLKKQ